MDSQGRRHSASLHPSSQAAQPTESGSQSSERWEQWHWLKQQERMHRVGVHAWTTEDCHLCQGRSTTCNVLSST